MCGRQGGADDPSARHRPECGPSFRSLTRRSSCGRRHGTRRSHPGRCPPPPGARSRTRRGDRCRRPCPPPPRMAATGLTPHLLPLLWLLPPWGPVVVPTAHRRALHRRRKVRALRRRRWGWAPKSDVKMLVCGFVGVWVCGGGPVSGGCCSKGLLVSCCSLFVVLVCCCQPDFARLQDRQVVRPPREPA